MWIQKTRAGVAHIAYSLDGRTLYTLDTGGSLTAWDTATHAGVRCAAADHLFRARDTRGIYPLDDGRLVVRFGGAFAAIDRSLAMSALPSPPGLEPDQFAHVGSDGRVDYVVRDNVRQILGCHLGNTKAWPVFALPESLGVLVGVHRFDWSRDRRTLAAILMDGVLAGFDVTPGGSPRPVRVVSVPNTYRIKLSPDGRTVVALSQYPDRFSLWDVATQTVRIKNVPMSFPGAAFAMNPVYPLFAACQPDGTLAIWSLDDGRAVRSLDFALGRAVRCVAFAPDGLTCAVGGTNKQFAVFDVDV